MNDRQRLEAIVSVVCKYLPPDGISKDQAITEIISLVDPLPEQEQGEPVAIIEELIPNSDSELLAVRWLSVEASFKNPVGTLLIPFKNIKEK